MSRVKGNFNIVAYDKAGQKVVLHQDIASAGMIALLKDEKDFIDNNYTKISVERVTDGLKFSCTIGANPDWVERVAQTFKLGKPHVIENSHYFIVAFAVYNTKNTEPVFKQDFQQSYVIKSKQNFQDIVFSKIVYMQQDLRVAVLRVLDVATNIDDPVNKKLTPLYTHVFYSHTIVPDMKGTGVHLNKNNKKDCCTPLIINTKVRTKTGGVKSYFGNQQDAIDAINTVVAEISKYNRRKFKTNGK